MFSAPVILLVPAANLAAFVHGMAPYPHCMAPHPHCMAPYPHCTPYPHCMALVLSQSTHTHWFEHL